MVAKFPGAIATDADLTVAADRIITNLAIGISATDTVLTLANTAGIVLNTLLGIDTELMLVTSITPLTVLRGFGGTAAAPHLAPAQTAGLIDAYHFNALSAEVQAIEATLGADLDNVAELIVPSTFSALFAQKLNYTPIPASGHNLNPGVNTISCVVPAGLVVGGSVYISGGTGSAEVAPVSAVSGASVTVTCANGHTGAWTMQSATLGIAEAIASLPAAGGVVDATLYTGAQTLFGGVVIPANVTVALGAITLTGPATVPTFRLGGNASRLIGLPGVTIVQSNVATGQIVLVANTNGTVLSQDNEVSGLTINLLNTTGTANGLDIYSAWYSNFRSITVQASGGAGSGIVLRDVTFSANAQGSYGATFDRCQVSGFTNGFWLNATTTNYGVKVVSMTGCWSSSNGVGLTVGGTASVRWVKIVGGAFSSNTSHGINLVQSDGLWVDGCDIEGNGGWGITGPGCTELSINASFQGNVLGNLDAGLAASALTPAKLWDFSDHGGANRSDINYYGSQPHLVMQNNGFLSKILFGIDIDGETMMQSANVRPTGAMSGTLIDPAAPGALVRVSSRSGFSYLSATAGAGARTLIQQLTITPAGQVGIGNPAPAYTLDVTGDINYTGTLRHLGVPVSGGSGGSGQNQTPWLSDIDAASFKLLHVGSLGVGNGAPVYPVDVTGDINASGTVRVKGVPVVTNPMTSNLDGGLFSIANLGNLQTGTLTVNNAASFNGGITVDHSNVHINNSAGVSDGSAGNLYVAGTIFVSGGQVIANPLQSDLNAGSKNITQVAALSTQTLAVAGAATVGGNLTVNSISYSDGRAVATNPLSTDLNANGLKITNAGTITANNVGINNPTPAWPLDVTGNINFTGVLMHNGVPVPGQTPWASNIDAATHSLVNISTLGIGTAAPGYPLDVTGDINYTGTLRHNGTAVAGLAPATATVLGGVKIGSNITVQPDGTISVALGTGTVTSVALAMPPEFTVTGSPVTGTGTLTAAKATQSANSVYAAPNGATGVPTFRALVGADLPVASTVLFGAVKADGTTITISAGVISAVSSGALTPATATVLGGVKIGANVTVQVDGTISVAAPFSLVAATATVLGGVKVGANITVAGDGTISAAAPFSLTPATASVLGGVKVGANITVAGDGTISMVGPWTSDVNAGNFRLTNINTIGAVGVTVSGTTSANLVIANNLAVNNQLGINVAVAHYPLDVTGDINYTGTLRQNGVAVALSQTPWTGNISAAGFNLDSVGFLGVGAASNGTNALITCAGSAGLWALYASDSSTTAKVGIRFANNLGNSALFYMAGSTATPLPNVAVLNVISTPLVFQMASAEKMRLSAAGQLGIGNAAPAWPLDVIGDINYTGTLRQNGVAVALGQTPWAQNVDAANHSLFGVTTISSNGSLALQAASTGTLSLSTSVVALTVATSGRVGVGTASPSSIVHVLTNTGTQSILSVENTGTASGDTAALSLKGAGTNASWLIFTNRADLLGTAGSVGFFNNANAKTPLVIADSGNVGIGTNTPAYALDVAGSLNVRGPLTLGPTETGIFTPALLFGGASTGITYSTLNGVYSRVNGVTTVSIQMVLSSKGTATGSATVAGLPFSGYSGSCGGQACPLSLGVLSISPSSGLAAPYAVVSTGSSVLLYQQNATNTTAITDTMFTNFSQINLTITYKSA